MDNNNRGKGRGTDLTILLFLLGVYANAEKVVLAHAPALKRAQRGDVVAAIAAKERPKLFAKIRLLSKTQKVQSARTYVETCRDGKQFIFCKGCKKM